MKKNTECIKYDQIKYASKFFVKQCCVLKYPGIQPIYASVLGLHYKSVWKSPDEDHVKVFYDLQLYFPNGETTRQPNVDSKYLFDFDEIDDENRYWVNLPTSNKQV
jgi:hypothetical protein